MLLNKRGEQVATYNKPGDANGEAGNTSDQVGHEDVGQIQMIRAMIMQLFS